MSTEASKGGVPTRVSDTIGWGTRGIKQRKLRSALTILGILVGTAAVVALVSQTQGIQSSILTEIDKLGSNTIIVRPASAAVILTDSDIGRMSQMPGVELAIPVIMSNLKVYGSQSAKSFQLIGVDPAYFNVLISDYEIAEGRLFETFSYGEMLVGSTVYQPQDMTSPFVVAGQSVTVEVGVLAKSRKVLNIVGVMAPYGATTFVSVDDSIFMSLKAASFMLGRTSYNVVFVKTIDPELNQGVVDYIKATYGTNVSTITVEQIASIVTSIIGQLTILLGAVAAISLFVAGLGIMNIMFVSVMERTKEIGVLKAVGFKAKNILTVFLSEAAMVGIIGGILGLLAGTGMSYIIPIVISRGFSSTASQFGSNGGGNGGMGSFNASSFTYSPVIGPDVALLVFIFALATSLVAGIYPAWRASRMDPVVALRHE